MQKYFKEILLASFFSNGASEVNNYVVVGSYRVVIVVNNIVTRKTSKA